MLWCRVLGWHMWPRSEAGGRWLGDWEYRGAGWGSTGPLFTSAKWHAPLPCVSTKYPAVDFTKWPQHSLVDVAICHRSSQGHFGGLRSICPFARRSRCPGDPLLQPWIGLKTQPHFLLDAVKRRVLWQVWSRWMNQTRLQIYISESVSQRRGPLEEKRKGEIRKTEE